MKSFSMRMSPVLALVLTFAFCACGGDDPAAQPGTGDVQADSGAPSGDEGTPLPDVADSEDASEGSEEAADATPDPDPKPVAPADEGVALPISSWMVTSLVSSDPILELLELGMFEMPEAGSSQGAYWTEVPTGESGSFSIMGTGMLFYGVAKIIVPEPVSAVVRADGVLGVYLRTAQQPGDIYHSKRTRVPIRLHKGGNILVVRGVRRNKGPEVEVSTTTHELVFNPKDLVVPDLEPLAPHEQWVGIPVLNTTATTALDVEARLLDSEALEETSIRLPALGPMSTVQVPFALSPKPALAADGEPRVVTLHIESASLDFAYETEIEIPTRDPESTAGVARTFRSRIDRSAQHYAVREPTSVVVGQTYGLGLALHGAGVGLKGMANAYAPKDWIYMAAPTNRRPFGFDWEAWGRLDGLEVLDLASSSLPIDPTRVFVTGHSMGGHGTWQFGVLFPGRFAVVAPSAGWISFETYASQEPFPNPPFGWACASSDTLLYIENLADRAVFGIHGTADDNVPVSQLETMVTYLEPIVDDLHVHYEEGAGHWWDGEVSEGADCVDWPPLFELLSERFLDPTELSFTFRSPGPGVSPTHSYATILSATTPAELVKLQSASDGDTVTLQTTNVRSMVLDNAALASKGISKVLVDGTEHGVGDTPIAIGPAEGKTPDRYGPLIQVFQQPFCMVWADGGPPQYREYASRMLSTWNIIGNGTACAMPLSKLTDEVRAEHNIVYLGVPAAEVPLPASTQMSWAEDVVTVAGQDFDAALLGFVFPDGDRLGAVLTTTRTHEYLVYRVIPFSSRFWIPDWVVLAADGPAHGAGFFGGDWGFEPKLSFPQGLF